MDGPPIIPGPGDAVRAAVQAEKRAAQQIVKATENVAEAKTYHRLGDSPEIVEKIKESGELWGRPPRNTFASEIPKAKAYDGSLPSDAKGIEFTTTVPPDVGSGPGKPTWSGARPGVTTADDFAKIPVQVTKDTVTKTAEKAAKEGR
jgi:hypothetical protein